jgi:hypothetical protein
MAAKTTTPKTIGFIGDTHCGSHYGLWPTEDLPGGAAGSKYKGIRYLNRCFQNLVDEWPELDLLVLMGDLVDGKQRKSSGTGVFSTKMSDQVAGAIVVLEPLAKKAKTIVRVHGTPYHEEFDGCLADLDRALGVKHTDQVININLDGKILNMAHHPIGGSLLYSGTGVDRENVWSTVAAAQKKVPNQRWIFRAHKHEYCHLENKQKNVVQLPCWELPTPHAVKQNYWRFQPDIGGVLMHADPTHDSGYRITPTLYDLPSLDVFDLRNI